MTLRQMICDAGVATLEEFLCTPCSGGENTPIYVTKIEANSDIEVSAEMLDREASADNQSTIITANAVSKTSADALVNDTKIQG